MRRKETLPFAKTWMDLEGITLSKISQIKTNTVGINYMWKLEKAGQTHRKRAELWLPGAGGGEGRKWGDNGQRV